MLVVTVMLLVVACRTGFQLKEPLHVVVASALQWLALGMVPLQSEVNGYQAPGLILAGVTWTIFCEWLFFSRNRESAQFSDVRRSQGRQAVQQFGEQIAQLECPRRPMLRNFTGSLNGWVSVGNYSLFPRKWVNNQPNILPVSLSDIKPLIRAGTCFVNKFMSSIITMATLPFVLCAIVVLGLVFVFVALTMFVASDDLGLP